MLLAVMVGKVSDWVPGLGIFPLVKISFALAAISAYRNRAALCPVSLRALPGAREAMAFMWLSILSVFFSIYKSNTLIASERTLIYLMIITLLVRVTQTRKDVERLLIGLAMAGASLSLGTLLLFHGGRASINANFDPNGIAYELDTLLPIVLALGASGSIKRRIVMYALAAGMAVAVLLTGSRGGAIGLLVDLILVIAFPLFADKDGEPRKFSVRATLSGLAIMALAGMLVWAHLPAETQARMTTLLHLQDDYNASPDLNSSRLTIWKRDLGAAMQRPIGYGMDSAPLVDGRLGGQYRTVHNSVLQAFLELGAIGLFLYLRSYYVTWKQLFRIGRDGNTSTTRNGWALHGRAMSISLAGNLAAGFFLSQAYSASLWMIVAITAASTRIKEDKVRRPAVGATREPLGRRRRSALARTLRAS